MSRSFSALQTWGLLQVTNRDVEITDLPALTSFARSTRKTLDERHALHTAPHDHRQRVPRSTGASYAIA